MKNNALPSSATTTASSFSSRQRCNSVTRERTSTALGVIARNNPPTNRSSSTPRSKSRPSSAKPTQSQLAKPAVIASSNRSEQFTSPRGYLFGGFVGDNNFHQRQFINKTLQSTSNSDNVARGEEFSSHTTVQPPSRLNQMGNTSARRIYYKPSSEVKTEVKSAAGRLIEQKANSERMNMNKLELTQCPLVTDEPHLKLLNLQYNNITRISNLEYLKSLIFLDLYNNKITEISNLECVPTLRVLMLGKNNISKIEGLSALKRLDVLDLHSNCIDVVENLDHLRELRVLNLAGNKIKTVTLPDLSHLAEINLRRNRIETVHGFDNLTALQRLFLSSNKIARYLDLLCVCRSKSLIELSLDGNPIAEKSDYRRVILSQCSGNLRHLDMQRVVEDISLLKASINIDEILDSEMTEMERNHKRNSTVKVSVILPKPIQKETMHVIQDTPRSISTQTSSSNELGIPQDNSEKSLVPTQTSPSEIVHTQEVSTKAESFLDSKSYVKISGTTLLVSGKLDILTLTQTANSNQVDQVHFHKIHYMDLIDQQQQLKTAMKQLSESLTLTQNSLETLQQIEDLCYIFSDVKRLSISDNPIYFSLKRILKPFCVCHFPMLLEFNKRSILPQDRINAEKIFKKRLVVLSAVENRSINYSKSVDTAHKYVSTVLDQALTIDNKMKVIDSEWDCYLEKMVAESLTCYITLENQQQHLHYFLATVLDK